MRQLLDPYRELGLALGTMGTQMHMGHVLLGLIHACQHAFGNTWHRHVQIIDWSIMQREFECHEEGGHQLYIVVLHTITPAHWSVLAVRGIDFQALLYDGKRLEQHSELAEVVYCALEEMLSFTAVRPIGHLKSPYQEDNWSCGHRLIMAIEILLQQGFH